MRTESNPLPQTPPLFAECLRAIARPHAFRNERLSAIGIEQIYDEYDDVDDDGDDSSESGHLIDDQEIGY